MNILQVNTTDIAGGAERVARNLLTAYEKSGHGSWLAVGWKRSSAHSVIEIPDISPSARPWARAAWAMRNWLKPYDSKLTVIHTMCSLLRAVGGVHAEIERQKGREDFCFPGTWQLGRLTPETPDIVHAHNLHGEYFDLRFLPVLSQQYPLVLTLHDEWMLTGHCACSLDCMRWEIGCGQCPDLTIYPAVPRDATAWNWQRKKGIYRSSRIYIATPSNWLMYRVARSMIQPVEARVIPNGIDLKIFHPVKASIPRSILGFPENAIVLLFVAQGAKHNPFKDYKTIEQTILHLHSKESCDEPIVFVALGGNEKEEEKVGNVIVKQVPFISDVSEVAMYYQAADIFLHAAHSDNFPTTVLEALACGTPVIATAVGGIPEQIIDGKTGFLTPPGDVRAMVDSLELLISDKVLRKKMGEQAAADARLRFDLDTQVDAYLDWYREICETWSVN